LAQIDTALGGQIAEKLFMGDQKVTSGCGGDLQGATGIAYAAVRNYGMFGDTAGFLSADPNSTSEEYNAAVDLEVKRILEESKERVTKLIQSKEKELRDLSKNLYWFDYLDAEEMEQILKGKKLKKEKVREWEGPKYLIGF